MPRFGHAGWTLLLLSTWAASDLTPPNHTERQGLVSILQRVGEMSGLPSVVQLGRAGLLCATSLTPRLFPRPCVALKPKKSQKERLSCSWKRLHTLLCSQLQCHPSRRTSPSPSALPVAGEWVLATHCPTTLGRIGWEGPSQTCLL